MRKKIKNHYIYILISLIILLYIFPIAVPISLTNSGILIIYGSYLIMGFFFFYYIIFWFKNRSSLSRPINILTYNYAILCIGYICVTIYRYLNNLEFYKSIQNAAVTLMPLTLFLMIISSIVNLRKITKTLIISFVLLNLSSIIYHVFIVKAIRSDFLVNINALVIIAIINLIFNIYTIYYNNEFLSGKCMYLMNIFNLVYSLIIIIISGSRSGVLIGGLSFVASIILGIRRSKKVIMTYTISLILSILISLIMVTTNWYSAGDMFFRATTLNTLTKTVSSLNMDITIEEASNKIVNISKQIESNNTDNNSDGQEQILIYNDLSRILLWKNALSEIKKSPIMGTGVISFKVSDDYYPSQSAHNFILEYALTFGGMGLLIWIVFFLNLIIGSYKMVRGEKKRPFLWLLISILFICGYSLLQPTLSMPAVTSITWLIVGVLWKFCDSSIVNED